MMTTMDGQIGRVVAQLEKSDMRDNTLIVFHSDNGGKSSACLSGESKISGAMPASSGPYRGGKGDLYEGGTRIVADISQCIAI